MNTNFFDTLIDTPDQSLLPEVWLTWETKTQGRLFLNCATGTQQRNPEPWMPSRDYRIYYTNMRQPQVVVTSGTKLRYAYSKYHEEPKLLELAVVEMNTNRTGGAREWHFAEGGSRYFIDVHKNIYSISGKLMIDNSNCRFFAYEYHTSYRFKDFLAYLSRCNINPSYTEGLHKLLGSGTFISCNGRAIEIKYAYHVENWYTTNRSKKTLGKVQQLLDELCELTSRDLTEICKIHGTSTDNDASSWSREVKDIIVYEQLNDEWGVFRYCYRDSNDNAHESYRVFVGEDGTCKCAKLNDADEWVPAQNQNTGWSASYGRIVNLDEASKSKRLSYIMPLITQTPESKQLATLTLLLKHPELEKLMKMGYTSLAKKLMEDNHVKANIKKYFGEPNKKAKSMCAEWGVNKHQLETINEIFEGNNHRYSYLFLPIIKKYFGNDISYMDNETFERIANIINKLHYNNVMNYIEDTVGADNTPHWLNRMGRIAKHHNTPNNYAQILADTIRSYRYLTNRPEIDWNFDSYSDIVRAHDAFMVIQQREQATRNARWNMPQAERLKKEEEMRKKVDEKRKHYEFEDGDFIIRLPIDTNEIVNEGSAQHICIAGYTTRHAEGNTNIFFLRKKDTPDTPFYAIEMRDNNISQIHGFGNKWLGNNPEAIPTVMRWMAKHNIACETKILTCTATGYSSLNATCVPMPKID